MANVKVIYGSSTGNTESAAAVIAGAFGTEAINITNAKPEDFEAGLLILGSSTWGLGELQDDWATGIAMLDGIDLTGRKVAVFGLGDQSGFGDTFVDAMGILANKAKERGAVLVGETSQKDMRTRLPLRKKTANSAVWRSTTTMSRTRRQTVFRSGSIC